MSQSGLSTPGQHGEKMKKKVTLYTVLQWKIEIELINKHIREFELSR